MLLFQHKLSRRERQVMDIVYARKQVTAAEIHEALPDRPTFSATRAVIRTLEEKGHLRHKERGLRYVYLPMIPLDKAKRSALAHVVSTFFQGSPSNLVATLLDSATSKISDEELNRLEELVRRAKQEQK
jgi:BlaI family penicillinase repressor